MSDPVEINQSLYALPIDIEESLARLEIGELEPTANERTQSQPDGEQTQKFTTPQEFWRYRDQLPQTQTESENQIDEFSSHVERLEQYATFCNSILEKTDNGLAMLANLKSQHHLVSMKTSTLHATCNKLLSEQELLDKNVETIRSPMKYFREVGAIAPLLGQQFDVNVMELDDVRESTPKEYGTVRIVSPRDTDQFKQILERLDVAIAFLDSHIDYRDAKLFGLKLRHLRHRGLTMVRDYVVESLRASADSVLNGLRVEQHSTSEVVAHNTYASLLYVRFRALAKELRPSVVEIENRVKIVSRERVLPGMEDGEYSPSDLLTDLHMFYCNQRSRLLHGYVSTMVSQHVVQKSGGKQQLPDLSHLLRAMAPQMRRLCLDEFDLFGTLFLRSRQLHDSLQDDRGDDIATQQQGGGLVGRDVMPEAYNDFMISLCTTMYDVLRPEVVKQSDLESLCVAVRVLQDEIMEAMLLPHGAGSYPIQYVVQLLLNDVKEKLALCADRCVRDEILGYVPNASDVDYPGKLLVLAQDSPENTPSNPKRARPFGWYYYATVSRTLRLLSSIYRLVDMAIFEDLMERAVSNCTVSLFEAAKAVQSKSTLMDAQLFLIKQLLILREQITGFVTTTQHVTEKRLDFATTSAAFKELMTHRGMVFTLSRRNALLELVQHGVPTVHEDQINCKLMLESKLRETCQQFRLGATNQLLGKLLPFLDRAHAFHGTRTDSVNKQSINSTGNAMNGQAAPNNGVPNEVATQVDNNVGDTANRSSNDTNLQESKTVREGSENRPVEQQEAVVTKSNSFRLAEQEFASYDSVLKILLEAKGTLVNEMRSILDQMAIYLRNPDTGVVPETRSILFSPIPTQVYAVLNDLRGIVAQAYPSGQSAELIGLIDAIRGSVSALSQASATGTPQTVENNTVGKAGNDEEISSSDERRDLC